MTEASTRGNLLVPFLIGLFLLCCLGGCGEQHPLAGSWRGQDTEGNEAILYLSNSGNFEALARGEKLTGKWSANLDVMPHRITFTFDEGQAFTTIFKLQGSNLLIEPTNDTETVPASFSEQATVYRKQS